MNTPTNAIERMNQDPNTRMSEKNRALLDASTSLDRDVKRFVRNKAWDDEKGLAEHVDTLKDTFATMNLKQIEAMKSWVYIARASMEEAK